MLTRSTDLGGEVKAVYVLANLNAALSEPLILTDAQPEDNNKLTSAAIDRMGYDSAVLAIPGVAHLADTKTLTFAVGILESDDNSSWDAEAVLQAATIAYTGIGTHLPTGFCVELNITLKTRKRYFKITITPATNAGGDTATWAAAVILGGKESLPAT